MNTGRKTINVPHPKGVHGFFWERAFWGEGTHLVNIGRKTLLGAQKTPKEHPFLAGERQIF